MDPMFCIGAEDDTIDEWNCVIAVGNTYGAPIFQHAGATEELATRCDCASPEGLTDHCDAFDFLAGLFVFDGPANQTALSQYPKSFQPFVPMMEFFYLPPEVGIREANDLAFKPAWTAIHSDIYPRPEYQDPIYRE